jgi:hypothetical protein
MEPTREASGLRAGSLRSFVTINADVATDFCVQVPVKPRAPQRL